MRAAEERPMNRSRKIYFEALMLVAAGLWVWLLATHL